MKYYAEDTVYELRGFIYYQQGQIFQAICNLSKATEAAPKSINSSFMYYLFLVEDGQEDKAMEEKQSSASFYPAFDKINKVLEGKP